MIRWAVSLLLLCSTQCVGDEFEFSIDVMSVLSKSGCNAGTCHGNLNGKGGLKLSLRGQDPQFDFESLVRASRGRRVNVAFPSQSLVLKKATGEIAHRGGIRFDEQSDEYARLLMWLNRGAHGPRHDAKKVTHLEVEPRSAVIVAPERKVRVRVVAHFSDGTCSDVTRRSCYELSNLKAKVDYSGLVERQTFGETTLIVRYLQEQVPVPIAFTEERPEFRWSDPQPYNDVDKYVFEKLKRLRLNPSKLCDDATFVRRAYLDAIGRAPTSKEAKRFVGDNRGQKRRILIDQLLTRNEFADFWAMKWADILRTEEKVLDSKGVEVFHRWIRDGIATAKPLDLFVRELVTGTGSTFENPAANYYRANRDPSTRGETTARLFLGTRLQCAKCHNHPFDRWTQDDYYQWSALFSQMDYDLGKNERKDKLDKNEFAGDQIVRIVKQDEIRNPATGNVVRPKYLGGGELEDMSAENRLNAVAQWLASSDNRLFVESQANFIWYQIMGRGLVEPIDDFRLTNPPSNPPLLDSLADSLVESGFDLRSLVRVIMNSRTYQAASQPNATNVHDETCYSRSYVRRLPAEVILDMQSDLLDVPAGFAGYDASIRAVQIPGVKRKGKSAQPGDRFLKTFGKPERILACECERSNDTTLKQAFVLIGDGLSDRLAESGNRVQRWARSSLSDAEVIREIYWTALSRPPTDVEESAALRWMASSGNGRASVMEDIVWAILNAKEFLFRN